MMRCGLGGVAMCSYLWCLTVEFTPDNVVKSLEH